MKKIIVSFLSALFLALAINEKSAAQDTELMQQICKEKVSQLSGYISNMASKDNAYEKRRWYMGKALKMFLGEGEAYTAPQGLSKTGVMTTVGSLNLISSNYQWKRMRTRDFFHRCANLFFTGMELQADTEMMTVKKFKQIDDLTYTCIVEGKGSSVECVIQYHDNEYSVLFGDMEVTVLEY